MTIQQAIAQMFASTARKPEDSITSLYIAYIQKIAEKLGLPFVENSPPLEGWSQTGVAHSPPMEGCPTGGVENSPTPIILTTINNIPIYKNFVQNLPYNARLKQLAKDKRKAGILSEVLFWQQVHKGAFNKIDFDRQRIIGNYMVDFYVKALGLVIEIDGSSHNQKQAYDAERQAYLESLGLKVCRIADIDVKNNLYNVMVDLENYIVKEYGGGAAAIYRHASKQEETTPVFDHPSKGGEFEPIDVVDYIYAVLYSPTTYRKKYKEFKEIDFLRLPYPKDAAIFRQLTKLGSQLRQLHVLESSTVEKYITQYPIDGDNNVIKPRFIFLESSNPNPTNGRVYINDTQYFGGVPIVAWEFYIGGYQPAQKWLKDRKGRKLEPEDIVHYQKIIVALTETERLIKEIGEVTI
jgi:very-short-patch-repair endonuclease